MKGYVMKRDDFRTLVALREKRVDKPRENKLLAVKCILRDVAVASSTCCHCQFCFVLFFCCWLHTDSLRLVAVALNLFAVNFSFFRFF